jgi:hypothetical protein
MHIQRLPIIHPCAPQIPIIDHVSERMNQMQPRARERAHAPDVSGVLRDFRLEKHDVQHTAIVPLKPPVASTRDRGEG